MYHQSKPIGSAKTVPRAALTDLYLRSIQPPEQGTADYWDSSFKQGLFGCRVSSGGAKTFIVKVDNSRRAIGRYGLLTLQEARTEARKLLAERTLGKARPQAKTFPMALDEFLTEKRKGRRPRTVDNHQDRLNRHFPFKGQLADITHQDLVRKLGRISSNSEHDHALSVAKTFFTWCHNRRYIDDNPTRGLSPHGSQSRARVLSYDELKAVWRAAENPEANLPTAFRYIVKLLILTGARRGEIAALQWAWISDNRIQFPREIMKNGRETWLPLLPFTRSVIDEISRDGELLFPARGRTDMPFSGWSKSFAELQKFSKVEGFTLHDLRRSWASHNAAWAPPHILERALSHVSGTISGVAAVYNRFQYEDELTSCYENWEAQLQKIVAS